MKSIQHVVAVLAGLALATGASAARAADMKVVFNSDWAPYSMGAVEDVRGILPELITELVSNHMGVPVEIIGYPWARVQHLVEQGQADAFITVPTDSRLQYALTSKEVAYTVDMRAAVKLGSAAEALLRESPSAESLRSLRTCDILANGWGKAYAAKNDITPVIASKVSNCLLMIRNGRVDTSLQSTVVAQLKIASGGLENEVIILPDLYGQMAFTFLLSKKSQFGQDFLDTFDATVKRMKDDGSYEALINRLHSVQ